MLLLLHCGLFLQFILWKLPLFSAEVMSLLKFWYWHHLISVFSHFLKCPLNLVHINCIYHSIYSKTNKVIKTIKNEVIKRDRMKKIKCRSLNADYRYKRTYRRRKSLWTGKNKLYAINWKARRAWIGLSQPENLRQHIILLLLPPYKWAMNVQHFSWQIFYHAPWSKIFFHFFSWPAAAIC